MGLLRRSRLQRMARWAATLLWLPWAACLKAAPRQGRPRCNLLRPPAPDCRTACVAAPARPSRQAQARARPAAARRALSGPRRRRARQRRPRRQPPHLPRMPQRGPRTTRPLRHTCGAAGGRAQPPRCRTHTPLLSNRGHGLAAHACMERAKAQCCCLWCSQRTAERRWHVRAQHPLSPLPVPLVCSSLSACQDRAASVRSLQQTLRVRFRASPAPASTTACAATCQPARTKQRLYN